MLGDCTATHFVFAKYLLPAMKCEAASSFMFITGSAGAWFVGGWGDRHLACCLFSWLPGAAGCPVAPACGSANRDTDSGLPVAAAWAAHFSMWLLAAGERCTSLESSLACVASGALHGMVLAAQEQFADFPFRINEMRLQAHIRRHSGE